MRKLLGKFVRDEQGLELSEYAIMAGLVIVIAILVITTVGQHINGIFDKLAAALSNGNKAPQ